MGRDGETPLAVGDRDILVFPTLVHTRDPAPRIARSALPNTTTLTPPRGPPANIGQRASSRHSHVPILTNPLRARPAGSSSRAYSPAAPFPQPHTCLHCLPTLFAHTVCPHCGAAHAPPARTPTHPAAAQAPTICVGANREARPVATPTPSTSTLRP
eukprot:216656-Chlamydomonas_euryale.AAC.1